MRKAAKLSGMYICVASGFEVSRFNLRSHWFVGYSSMRSLRSSKICIQRRLYQRKTEGRSSISNSEKTALHRQSLSIAKQPLVKIPIENVISAFAAHHPRIVSKRNHCRKLLAGDGPKRIADVIAGNSKHSAVEKLLTVLEVEQLSELTKAFFQCLRTEFPDVSVTSKAHLLCSHVVGFVRCHGFWGLISEQSVESLHRKQFRSIGFIVQSKLSYPTLQLSGTLGFPTP
uniref:Uncharacterized protein n=1 Tax=Ditylenchus dipsaci TaxID=166011 RepID=A0A915DAR1_9BILA